MNRKIATILGMLTMLVTVNFQASAQLSEEVVKRTPELPGEIVVDFGYNLLYNKPSHWNQTHWYRSPSFAVYFTKPVDITDKIEVIPGIGMSFEKYGSRNADFLEVDEDVKDPYITIPDNDDIIKAKAGLAAFEIPIELRYNFGGNDDRTSPFISVAPAVAFIYESKLKVKYGVDGEKQKIKQKGDADYLDANKFRFGLQGRIGWGQFAVFYKHYFTPIFEDGGLDGTGETMFSTVGLSISGF